jgi:curved DNA-binding protein CbpA
MPRESFRGDPYRVLDLAPDAPDAAIKRRWRELANQYHPDRATGDPERAAESTRRMARINAAYELLRDPDRRRRFDAGRRSEAAFGSAGAPMPRPAGPPPPRPSPPVTARFDTSEAFHVRNATTSQGPVPLRGHPPIGMRERTAAPEPPRASWPAGPVRRRHWRTARVVPSLPEARATELAFGKFRGHTLGEVADFEPTYIDWIARTITTDFDLVQRARVVQADLDERGDDRRPRPAERTFGSASEGGAAARDGGAA